MAQVRKKYRKYSKNAIRTYENMRTGSVYRKRSLKYFGQKKIYALRNKSLKE
jgi:hypothetical protein